MIDVVIITTGQRYELLCQSIDSMRSNRSYVPHTLTVVMDDHTVDSLSYARGLMDCTLILHSGSKGASASRNIGASSIPRYRRQKYVMFLDDDVYMCPKWDEQLITLAEECETTPHTIISGHAHPFNHGEPKEYQWLERAEPNLISDSRLCTIRYKVPLVISSVHMLMPWAVWDDVGYFIEPGGPGGSEDYDYCMRAKDKGYGFAVTDPQCVIHTGITSSSGKPIIGQKEVIENNRKIEALYGLQGKVIYPAIS